MNLEKSRKEKGYGIFHDKSKRDGRIFWLYRGRSEGTGEKKTYAMYSPKSVVDAMLIGVFDNYWNQTETYEALKSYIQLKDAVIKMRAGDKVKINTGTFTNDMTTFHGKDDVLTLRVHLGYLSFTGRTEPFLFLTKRYHRNISMQSVLCSGMR